MAALRNSLHAKLDTLLVELLKENYSDNAIVQLEVSVFEDDDLQAASKLIDRVRINHRRLMESLNGSTSKELSHLPPPLVSDGNDGCEIGGKSPSKSTQLRRLNSSNNTVDLVSPHRRSAPQRHKATGKLRPRKETGSLGTTFTPLRPPSPPTSRQLETDDRAFPKRRRLDRDGPAKLEQSTINKLIEGIWEQIHRPGSLSLGEDLQVSLNSVIRTIMSETTRMACSFTFDDVSRRCSSITSSSRTTRALEVIVQAHWVDCYEERIAKLGETRPDLKTCDVKKMVLAEACKLFGWTEKELRNRTAIWRGYREIKNAAGWAALVFAGPGIYRFCKYRLGFDQEALLKMQQLQMRIEVAADTLQPRWRQLLSLVGAPTQLHWRGHAHDWIVSRRKDPVPLAFTYKQWDPDFEFMHLEESVVDVEKWGECDPRRSSNKPPYICDACSRSQSTSAETNECDCFPDYFGPNPRSPPAVQIFRTENGRNNGLIACCAFERGSTIGEFIGLVTKGLNNVDVMQSQVTTTSGVCLEPYQIWQGRKGNFTRFINHSCQSNSQFITFTWLGVQRILVVSKGIPAGKEITVDYSGRYWRHLDKDCLCGEVRCRYSGSARRNGTAR